MFFPTKKTVDSVLVAFKAAITDLNEVSAREKAEAARMEQEAAELKAGAEMARLESARAESAIERLQHLCAISA
jgi:hypothetical protein